LTGRVKDSFALDIEANSKVGATRIVHEVEVYSEAWTHLEIDEPRFPFGHSEFVPILVISLGNLAGVVSDLEGLGIPWTVGIQKLSPRYGPQIHPFRNALCGKAAWLTGEKRPDLALGDRRRRRGRGWRRRNFRRRGKRRRPGKLGRQKIRGIPGKTGIGIAEDSPPNQNPELGPEKPQGKLRPDPVPQRPCFRSHVLKHNKRPIPGLIRGFPPKNLHGDIPTQAAGGAGIMAHALKDQGPLAKTDVLKMPARHGIKPCVRKPTEIPFCFSGAGKTLRIELGIP
jgi:hypothetical protein